MPSLMLAVAVVAMAFTPAAAQEFRVENRIYIADDTAPASSSVTLFTSDAVYDFLADTDETTVFDVAAGRIVLMAPESEVRTEWQTEQLAEYTAEFKSWASEHKDPLLKFLAAPEFKETRGRAGKTVKLSSRLLVYDVSTERPDSAAAAQRYAEFSDWFAQLNFLTRRETPPFARMRLNRSLAEVGVLPVEVRKLLTPTKGEPQRLRSTHEITWSLSSADRRRIDGARQQLATLKPVPHSEYERLAAETDAIPESAQN
jgi:hypothetical protein